MKTPSAGSLATYVVAAAAVFVGFLAGVLLPQFQAQGGESTCRDAATTAVTSLNAYDEYLDAALDNTGKAGKLDASKVKAWEEEINAQNSRLWEIYPECAKEK